MKFLNKLLFLFLSLVTANTIFADSEVLDVTVSIENHRFNPALLELPAGRKINLEICNRDNTVEEFESTDLKREKIVPAHSCIRVVLAPLKKGTYNFFGEFYKETASGKIVVN
jgi:hypothetical protein